MISKLVFVLSAALMFVSGVVCAGNADLSKTAMVPTGERVANYLQGTLSTAGELVSAKQGGDLFGAKKPFRLAFGYDPENQVINVYVSGDLDKFADCRSILELVQKLILSLNKKIEKYYGVTLAPNDLAMDYFNLNLGQKIAKFENGNYVDNTKNLIPTPTVVEPFKMQEP